VSADGSDRPLAGDSLTFEDLLAVAEERDDVLGLYLFGSRGRDLMVDAASDWDVCVVLRDRAALARFDDEFPYRRGALVEITSTTLDDLRADDDVFGTSREQEHYAAAHIQVLVDKTGGELAEVVASQELIPHSHRDQLVREALDAYINATYRSLRYGNRLDALESLPAALRTIFGLAGRIRPFNKYLEWELRQHPVEGWDADDLLALIDSVVAANEDGQREMFRRIEAAARSAGYGDVVDGWEPDLAWLRGDAGYRQGARGC
jgi:predicted nucleotidyltransferase